MHRHKSHFQNPLRQNYHHVRVVEELLGARRDQLDNLVVFVGSATPKTAMPQHVFWSRNELRNYIASQKRPRCTAAEVKEFAEKLQKSALESNKQTRQAHVQHVRQKALKRQVDTTKCPRCGGDMHQRTNRKTGQAFWGCARYPKCRGTRQIR
ncbi:topoisomerase DNA-binding C4 zinc finger domain-containing protein [Roseovarius nubinhibens]|nr:topoisomerase DNA-binding C4 zinc finger domain-containing protein [Roseovarius nubinhibens]